MPSKTVNVLEPISPETTPDTLNTGDKLNTVTEPESSLPVSSIS